MKKLFLMSALLIFLSCNNDDNDPCVNTPVNFSSLEIEYGCVDTKNQTDINLNNDFVIIKNQTDFDSQVTGNCQPSIDFNTYDLVIGKQSLTNGNTSITYNIEENCETNTIEMEVTFNQNETTEAPNLTFHALLPKLEINQNVLVTVQIN